MVTYLNPYTVPQCTVLARALEKYFESEDSFEENFDQEEFYDESIEPEDIIQLNGGSNE